MKKLIFIIILVVLAFVGMQIGLNSAQQFRNNDTLKQVLPITTQNIPTKTSQSETVRKQEPGTPQIIRIPKIGINASIEFVSLDSQNRMDVPKDADNAGWYSLGYKPGEAGNAVLAGHLDRIDGSPAIFWNISELQQGDQILISDSDGQNYTFSVTATTIYPYDQVPLQELFGSSSQAMLHLITCKGEWDNSSQNYSEREVVSAELVQ